MTGWASLPVRKEDELKVPADWELGTWFSGDAVAISFQAVQKKQRFIPGLSALNLVPWTCVSNSLRGEEKDGFVD